MDRPCLPAIHFLLLPGVDAANFLGDLLRQFSLDEHKSGSYAMHIVDTCRQNLREIIKNNKLAINEIIYT